IAVQFRAGLPLRSGAAHVAALAHARLHPGQGRPWRQLHPRWSTAYPRCLEKSAGPRPSIGVRRDGLVDGCEDGRSFGVLQGVVSQAVEVLSESLVAEVLEGEEAFAEHFHRL